MKLNVYFIFWALLGSMSLQSCDDDDSIPVSPELQRALAAKHPGATRIEWEAKGGYYVADFYENKHEISAWFTPSGEWHMTETDIPFNALPEAVKSAFQRDYAGWRVDDVDRLERLGVETVYVIEAENKPQELDLYYSEEGILIKSQIDTDDNQGGHQPALVPAAVETFIKEKYPNARIVETDFEHGMLEVDIIDGGVAKDLHFSSTYEWISTSWDVHVNSLPAVITTALAQSEYSNYRVDDAEYYETLAGDYYWLELERGNSERKVKIDTNGKFIL